MKFKNNTKGNSFRRSASTAGKTNSSRSANIKGFGHHTAKTGFGGAKDKVSIGASSISTAPSAKTLTWELKKAVCRVLSTIKKGE
jgi:hypothetical protein